MEIEIFLLVTKSLLTSVIDVSTEVKTEYFLDKSRPNYHLMQRTKFVIFQELILVSCEDDLE